MNNGIRLLALLAWSWCLGALAATTPLATLTLGNDTEGMGIDPVLRKAYVTNYASGTISVIDLDTNTLAGTFNAGTNPRRLIVDAAHHLVYWVNDTNPGGVTVFDGSTNAFVTRITVGNRPRTIASDFQKGEVYAGNRDGNSVSVIDTGTNTVVRTIPVGRQPAGIDVGEQLNRIYVVNRADNTVSVIDQASGATVTVPVGRNPGYARVDERTGKAYVNNVDDKTMSIIGPANTVVKTIPTGAGTVFNFAAASGVYRRIYLANAIDNTLTIIDTDTDTVVRTVGVGAAPQDVIVDGSGGNVYVVNQDGNSVSVLDARTETVIRTVPVGTSPWRIAAGADRVLTLNQNGDSPDSVTITTQEETLAGTSIATDWYHAAFDHYFHSADEVENRLLFDGRFGEEWKRTMQFFRVWTEAGTGRQPVCRFFSASFAPKSSHFYTPYPAECELRKADPAWQFESGAVYYLALTDASGNCATGTVPLYRVYNNGQGGAPNHRYTADRNTRDQMKAMGWVGEGNGADEIFACTPTLRGD